MAATIHPIKLGVDTCYVVAEREAILIDGGAPNKAAVFRRALEALAISPSDIRLIVVTHAHWDHIGSVRQIRELTGARVALHESEAEWMEKGLKPVPPGVTLWARVLGRVLGLFLPLIRLEATEVDVLLGEGELSLAVYGVSGKVLHTPGHSRGSVTVLLDTGEAFVGDLAMSGPPLRRGPGLPIFAEDREKLRRSWELLLARGATTIYPAHGKPFPAEVIRKALGSG